MAWEKLGVDTLTVAGDNLDVTITEKKFVEKMSHEIQVTGTMAPFCRVNADAGNNYANKLSNNGGSDGDNSPSSVMGGHGGSAETADVMGIEHHFFLSGEHLLLIDWEVTSGGVGSDNAPNRTESVGKHTAVAVTAVNELLSGTGDFAIDSNLSVLGTD